MPTEHILPDGLKYHCACRVVVPADLPDLDEADCQSVIYGKLAWFNPRATPEIQFRMAKAAWELIHHKALLRQK